MRFVARCRFVLALSSLAALAALSRASAQVPAPAPAAPAPAQPAAEAKPFKIGIVTFLSGAAAGPFGVPARNAAEVTVEALNGGKVPAPYAKKGLGGRAIE
ncbi:MAG TPA: hypothetical protein VIW03_00670, partial [Anaeromyxobacter sp.]